MSYVPSDHEHAPKVAATPARQARWGRHAFWVLVVSTLLAAIALFAAWGFRSHDLTRAQVNSQPTIADTQNIDTTSAARPAPQR